MIFTVFTFVWHRSAFALDASEAPSGRGSVGLLPIVARLELRPKPSGCVTPAVDAPCVPSSPHLLHA